MREGWNYILLQCFVFLHEINLSIVWLQCSIRFAFCLSTGMLFFVVVFNFSRYMLIFQCLLKMHFWVSYPIEFKLSSWSSSYTLNLNKLFELTLLESMPPLIKFLVRFIYVRISRAVFFEYILLITMGEISTFAIISIDKSFLTNKWMLIILLT